MVYLIYGYIINILMGVTRGYRNLVGGSRRFLLGSEQI
jgi:hypothetical protein